MAERGKSYHTFPDTEGAMGEHSEEEKRSFDCRKVSELNEHNNLYVPLDEGASVFLQLIYTCSLRFGLSFWPQ